MTKAAMTTNTTTVPYGGSEQNVGEVKKSLTGRKYDFVYSPKSLTQTRNERKTIRIRGGGMDPLSRMTPVLEETTSPDPKRERGETPNTNNH